MPSAAEGPTVALSFANNFWGKDDAGVGPLFDRMASSKQTSDELRSFYSARASIEDEYARKLASLSKKALGSHEMGSLKASLDTVRGEVDSISKQHASIAAQMKTELEEPLAAFAGGMKERRKIIQNTVEKILKVKIQQTHTVNKTRDRYEQDCLRIKGYLAQGHMVMGQEERKNKAKLEKTQISLASTNAEYEAAVRALEETTARWNREWKAAADKFQDLEEERLDFTKSSLWTFANLASTVCVSDDASCEKIRLSLEKMDVEGDITFFINEKGTGQEIPDPPKYINFRRGDMDDHKSDISEEEHYSVAQFPRSINPAFRTASPQPSTYESHHDPNCALARDLSHQGPAAPPALPNAESHNHSPQALQHPSAMQLQHSHPQGMPPHAMYSQALPLQAMAPPNMPSPRSSHSPVVANNQVSRPTGKHRQNSFPPPMSHTNHPRAIPQQISHPSALSHQNSIPQPHGMPPLDQHAPQDPYASQDRRAPHSMQSYDGSQFSAVPHDPYPMDGMTMLCRTDGMNMGPNSKVPSRFEMNAMKPPTSNTDVVTRAAVLNSASTSDAPARHERNGSTANANAPPRYDIMKFPGPPSNVQPRTDGGLNSSTSSNPTSRQEAGNSASIPNLSGSEDPGEYTDPTSFSSQEPPSGKVSPTKPTPGSASPVTKAAQASTPPVQTTSSMTSPVKTTAVIAAPVKPTPISTSPVKTSPFNKTTPGSTSPVKTSPFKTTPAKTETPAAGETDKRVWKKRSGFFQNHSPFRRKSTKDVSKEVQAPVRHSWGQATASSSSTQIRPRPFQIEPRNMLMDRVASPDPIDANASLALNVGENVFPVANADKDRQPTDQGAKPKEEQDPIALALAELKVAGDHKSSANRVSADRYHGIATPAPEPTSDQPEEHAIEGPQTQDRARPFSRSARADSDSRVGMRGTPPPSYDMPVQRLGVPPPAVTSKAMQEASRKYTSQTRQILGAGRPQSVYNSAPSRTATRHGETSRATSPAQPRSVSPRPETRQGQRSVSPNPYDNGTYRSSTRQGHRSVSPNPYGGSPHGGSPQPSMTSQRGSAQGYYQQNSPNDAQSRTTSPMPYRADYDRPISRGGAMAVQLASAGGEGSIYGSVRSRGSSIRPGTSASSRAMSFYDARDGGAQDSRQRSRSVADPSRQYTPEGRAILHYARALYMYQAAIPEELGFAKGDILAVLRHQDDGWWEAEIHSGNGVGQGGLVPSNYLQPC